MLEESFDSVKVLIAFGGQRRHRDRFHAENKEYYAKVMTIAKIDAISNPAMEMLGMLRAGSRDEHVVGKDAWFDLWVVGFEVHNPRSSG